MPTLLEAKLYVNDTEIQPDACAWVQALRLRVTTDKPLKHVKGTSGSHQAEPQVVISHGAYAGVWSVDFSLSRVDACVIVLMVRPYTERAFPQWPFELVLGEHGCGVKVAPLGTVAGAPTVSSAPPLVMHTRTTIFVLDAIDTVAQTFRADVFVEVRLRNVSFEQDEAGVLGLLAQCAMRPDFIQFLNVSEFQTEPERWTTFSERGDFAMKMRARATFTEQFELADFPFDMQDVTVMLTVQCPSTRVLLIPNEQFGSRFLAQSFQLGAVFDLLNQNQVAAKASLSSADESAAGIRYPRCAFSIKLQRRYGYFVNNIIAPVGIITLVAPLSAATEPDGARMGTGDRLAYSLTLLLTAVAYKFAIASAIPQVSYLTLIESYTLVCFAFMWVNLVEAAAWPSIGYAAGQDGQPVELFDEWIYALVFVCAFAAYNVHFGMRVRKVLRANNETRVDARAAELADS